MCVCVCVCVFLGFPGGTVVKNPTGDTRDMGSVLSQEDPLRRKWQPTPVFFPGEFHGQRSLVGYSPWGRKESDTTERLIQQTCSRIKYKKIQASLVA